MKHKVRYIMLRLSATFLLFCLMFACANIGNPNGGPYDEDPPKFVASKPAINQLHFNGKKIEVFFDEYITLESPSENVIVTPPQKQNPFIQGVGKKILVELKDTLKENTTYTIDFTSSITDNNEKNVLENFSFAFSTGDVLDTLQISGILINAEDLEPVQRVLVGIHNDLSDTAFTKTPFLRTSKTDEQGRFTIHNVSPGAYHLFAVEDKNRNYAYDKNNDEALAFLDSVIIPTCERSMVPDTIWRDTIEFDTVLMVEKTLFYPNDLILWFSKDTVTPRQRLLRTERPQDYIFTLKFNAPMDTFPVPIPLNFEPRDSLWYVTQREESQENFSINYWILDSMIYKIDTLQVCINYWKNNDTIPDLIELQADTFDLVNKDAAQKKKKKAPRKKPPKVRPNTETSADSLNEEEVKAPIIPLQVTVTPFGSLNPHDIISVKFNEPVMEVRKEFFVLELGVDTLWETVDFEFKQDPALAMAYNIIRPFNYEERYRLTIDSAMLCSVYGHCNDSISTTMTVKSEKDYGHLIVSIQGLPTTAGNSDMPITGGDHTPDAGDSIPENGDHTSESRDSVNVPVTKTDGNAVPAFMELLNSSGSPVAKAIVENGNATFKNMPPEKYYARLALDTNGNGVWDAGNYEERKQPERVIYFMLQFELRQNWKIEETWDLNKSKPGEKPSELLKNKPKKETKKKRDYKEESKPRKSSSSSTNIRGLGGLGL